MVTEKKAIEIFENKNFDQDIDIIKIDNQGSRKITDILTSQQLITSKSEVKRMIENNGIKLNDISIIDINYEISDNEHGAILKIGKKRIFKIYLKS